MNTNINPNINPNMNPNLNYHNSIPNNNIIGKNRMINNDSINYNSNNNNNLVININNSKNIIINNNTNNNNNSRDNTKANNDSMIAETKKELNMLMYSKTKGMLNPNTTSNNSHRSSKQIYLNKMKALPTSSQGSA